MIRLRFLHKEIRNKDLIYFSRVLSGVFIAFKVVKTSWGGKTDPTQKLTKVTRFAGCKPFIKDVGKACKFAPFKRTTMF